jgi:hypothetical protein
LIVDTGGKERRAGTIRLGALLMYPIAALSTRASSGSAFVELPMAFVYCASKARDHALIARSLAHRTRRSSGRHGVETTCSLVAFGKQFPWATWWPKGTCSFHGTRDADR